MKHLKSWFEKQCLTFRVSNTGILMFGGGIIGTALMYLIGVLVGTAIQLRVFIG